MSNYGLMDIANAYERHAIRFEQLKSENTTLQATNKEQAELIDELVQNSHSQTQTFNALMKKYTALKAKQGEK